MQQIHTYNKWTELDISKEERREGGGRERERESHEVRYSLPGHTPLLSLQFLLIALPCTG